MQVIKFILSIAFVVGIIVLAFFYLNQEYIPVDLRNTISQITNQETITTKVSEDNTSENTINYDYGYARKTDKSKYQEKYTTPDNKVSTSVKVETEKSKTIPNPLNIVWNTVLGSKDNTPPSSPSSLASSETNKTTTPSGSSITNLVYTPIMGGGGGGGSYVPTTPPTTSSGSSLPETPVYSYTYLRQIYVDQSNPSASDSNDGSASHPFKTISKAMTVLRSGDEVIIGPGTYRERVTLPAITWGSENTMIRGESPFTALIKGSVLVGSWVPVNSDTYYADWSSGVEPEQVFRGGVSLQQIGGDFDGDFPSNPNHILFKTTSGLSHVWPGRISGDKDSLIPDSFTYDKATKRIYIRLSSALGAGENLEVSDKLYTLDSTNAKNVTIKDLAFKHSNTTHWARHAALHMIGTNITLDHLDIRDTDGYCVNLYGDNNSIVNSTLDSCGQAGINAGGNNVLISGNYITNANTRGFGKSWEAGGMKIVGGTKLVNSTISNNTIVYNHGYGIWFDWQEHDDLVKNNICSYNEGHGIHIEASQNVTLDGNFTYGNGQRGIYYLESTGGVIKNNLTIRNVLEGIAIADGTRSSPTNSWMYPYNNSASGNISGWNGYTGLRLQLVLPGKLYNNTSDNNIFYHNEFLPRFMYGLFTSSANPYYQGLTGWRATSSQDMNSQEYKMDMPSSISSDIAAKLLISTSTLWATLYR